MPIRWYPSAQPTRFPRTAGRVPWLAAVLAIAAGLTSMQAEAQFGALERLVMPGPVVASHAEAEAECANCHARFERQSQNQLCLTCHEEVAADLTMLSGFHGLSPGIAGAECASCHTDHEGRDADILGLDRGSFDHELTNFPLLGRHVDVECESCHVPEETFHAAEPTCIACHAEDDQHHGNLGEACSDCHTELGWDDVHFDHEATADYALTGAHAEQSCVACHVGEIYENTPNTCVDCHREEDEHMGTNGPECQDCHTTADWAETLFDHFARTEFALTGGHSGLECESCHEGNKFETQTPTECVGCHLEDDAHDGINGTECATCHRATEWLDVSFDHARDAEFPLNGAHADIECADCHVDPVADALPATECFGCHMEDDPHETQLGEACGSCHGELTWTDNVRFDHDLTVFPLLGRHGEIECEDCHETPAFHDAPGVCIDCHLEDDAHGERLGSDCALCHTPLGWLLWRFDHNNETDFVLDGAHDGLECESCHTRPASDGNVAVSMTCNSCHRSDDIHRGEFGDDCAACHTTESFESLRSIR